MIHIYNPFKFILTSFILSLLIIPFHSNSFQVSAQIVNVELTRGVYEFLERMNLKSFIILDDEAKPYSRKYIAEKIIEIKNKIQLDNSDFSEVEFDELRFWASEFYYEINQMEEIKYFTEASNNHSDAFLNKVKERWFLYSYSDSLFNLKLSPIAGFGLSTTENLSGRTRWVGASMFGSYSDWFGFSFDIRDKGEFGDNVDKNKYFSPIRGAWTKGAPNGIEYSDVKGSINFNWSWGQISLAKDYLQWGHGKFGQLILSDKAPSYPQIRLQIKPVEWLRFSYIHGWLSSQVYDSSAFYYSYPNSISETLVKSYIPKYIAANMLTISPVYWLDISFGNSVIYGGDIRPEFFIPFMFYKFLDHNSGRGDVNDANGVMYFDVSAKYPKNFKFYGTMFIDVTEIRNILDNDFENTWIGFTLGGKSVDVLFNSLDVTLEYTRLNPWVYEHKNEVTNYKHLKYNLGHWLGQNSDQLRIQFNYQLLRGLKFQLFAEQIRKGGIDEIYFAYSGMDEKDFPFLYSPTRRENRIGLDVSFEYLHDLVIKGSYIYSDITDEDKTREPIFLLGSKNSFSITLFYGI
ncbi:MAG: capsule assembly Wzi family protein [Ignavibacteriaceae bacterium]